MTIETADVAILIVAYKSHPTWPRLVAALNAQTRPPKEIFILENGSPAGERIGPDDVPPGAAFILSETNLGFAAGNNRLAEQASASWLAFLNPDAFPYPDWLEALMAATARYPHAALFGSTQYANAEATILDGAGDVYHASGFPYRGGYGQAAPPPPEGEVFSPCAAAALIRRDVFEGLGGFDEDYFCYVEDVDLGYRARLLGHLCLQIPAARVEHIGAASSGRRSPFAVYYGTRNRLWTFFKNTPGWLVWLLAPGHFALTGVRWLSSARFGRMGAFSRGVRDAFAGWGPLMAKRRAVQISRQVKPSAVARAMTWSPFKLLRRTPDVRTIKTR